MRHVSDAKKLIDAGKSREALDILDNLLGLAPRNHEALRLKASLLDAQGRFDESLLVLRDLARFDGLSPEALRDLEQRTLEEREVAVYSELTSEGRWYFAFPAAQLWISLYGFLGCAFFLLISPGLLGPQVGEALPRVAFAFFIFVALPWMALVIVHMIGIKKIFVGLGGLRICTRFREREIPWSNVVSATLEHHPDNRFGELHLVLYGHDKSGASLAETEGSKQATATVLARLNVSPKHSVVRARRHFVRAVLTHIDVVSYVTLEPDSPKGIKAPEHDARSAG